MTAPGARLGKALTDETLRFETIVSALAMAVAVHLLGARLDEQLQRCLASLLTCWHLCWFSGGGRAMVAMCEYMTSCECLLFG